MRSLNSEPGMPAKRIIEDINLSNFRAGFNLYVFFSGICGNQIK
jgi:hypothetical protein